MPRKCGLFVLLFVVLSTSLSVFFSDVSRAASVYDDLYKTTPDLKLGVNNYGGNTCDIIDHTQDWYTAALGATSSGFDWKSSLQAAVNGNGRWGVSQVTNYYNGGQAYYYSIYWTEDDSLSLNWTENYVQTQTPAHSVLIRTQLQQEGSGDCDNLVSIYNGQSSLPVSNNVTDNGGFAVNYTNLFFNADESKLNYPPGYEGIPIVTSLGDDRQIIKPDFKYIVNDKSLSLTDYNKKLPDFTPDEGYTFNGYEVEWSLFKCDVSANSPSTCLNPILANHQILPQSSTYQYSVDEYHTYMIEAQYLVQQCYRYPSYPATPDYCFYVDLNTEFDDYRFLPTSVSLDIDGSVIIGDTTQDDCDESGYCKPKKGNDLYEYFNGRENFGLTAILLAPILFYQQLPSLAESCTPINFSWFGRPVSLPCIGNSMQIWSPTVFGIYQAVVNAFVAYYVALGIFRTIKTVNDPKEDRIEVTTL